MTMINSKEYWDDRFSNDWDETGGSRQSLFFYSLIIEYLPAYIKDKLESENWSVCDLGAGNGIGTSILSETYLNSTFVGIDISQEGIMYANKQYFSQNCKFLVRDIMNENIGNYDLIISSNTLEHFRDPARVIEKLTEVNANHLVLLLPYQEKEKIKEHFVTFDESNIPVILNSKYVLNSFKIIDASNYENSCWDGFQVLTVYTKFENVINNNLYVNDIFMNSFISDSMIERKLMEIEKKIERQSNLSDEKITFKINKLNELMLMIEKRTYSKRIKNALDKCAFYFKKDGLIKTSSRIIKKGYGYVLENSKTIEDLTNKQSKVQLNKILDKSKYKKVIVFPPVIDWDVELFQRPHHIAKRLAGDDVLYFFCTPNHNDVVNGFRKLGKNLYLTNKFNLVSKIYDCIFHCYSTDNFNYSAGYDFYEKAISNGNRIIYEYIDEIHEDISGINIPEDVWKKHNLFIKNESVICIASADKLIDDIKEVRNKNYKLVTNGVDVSHFRKNFDKKILPTVLENIVDKAINDSKKIIGYFGAFASWFDYELIKKIAETNKFEIVLIGVDYDSSISKSGLENYSNIYYLGPVKYQELPDFAIWFDILIIPFLINDITISTSPIKLFEYMAMEKPIVTTAMPECKKYKGVFVADNHAGFIEKLNEASEFICDNDYRKDLLELAEINSWDEKAKSILSMIHIDKI